MRKPPVIAGMALAGVLALAGCGSPPTYSLPKTRTCLKQAGARIVAPKSDFVAQSATAGAFRALLPDGNAVTLAFGRNAGEAKQTADGYVRFHAANVGINDVLSLDRNVVLLWQQHASDTERTLVANCLK